MQDEISQTGDNTSGTPSPAQISPVVPHKPATFTDAGAVFVTPPDSPSEKKPELPVSPTATIVAPEEPVKDPEVVMPVAPAVASPVSAEEVKLPPAEVQVTPSLSEMKTESTLPIKPESEKNFEERITALKTTLEELNAKRSVIEEQSTSSFSEKSELESALAPILLREKLVVEELEEIVVRCTNEKNPVVRREVNKERWNIEDKRRAIEAEKWPIYEKLEIVDKTIKESEHAFMALVAEETKIHADIYRIETEAKQCNLQVELEKISHEKSVTEEELAALHKEHSRLSAIIIEQKKHESKLEVSEQEIDAKAEAANSLYEERVLAEERHKLEDERRKAEEAEWEAEDDVVSVSMDEVKEEELLKTISEKEADVVARLKELE